MKSKSVVSKFLTLFFGILLISFFASCGSDDDNDNNTAASTTETEEIAEEGQYRVVLSALNPDYAGNLTGSGSFLIEGDTFRAQLQVSGAPDAMHPQFIYAGSECPLMSADSNGDGIVDAQEAAFVVGGQLIPLDSDLAGQEAGGSFGAGTDYSYDQSTSFALLVSDLRQEDVDLSDFFIKLQAEEKLTMEGRVVLIHGLAPSTSLPETVLGLGDLSAQETLPILCGVITRESE